MRLKELRNERGLSQEDIAKKLNFSQKQISNWETGKVEPDISNLIKLAEFFEVTVDYLIGRTDEFGNKV